MDKLSCLCLGRNLVETAYSKGPGILKRQGKEILPHSRTSWCRIQICTSQAPGTAVILSALSIEPPAQFSALKFGNCHLELLLQTQIHGHAQFLSQHQDWTNPSSSSLFHSQTVKPLDQFCRNNTAEISTNHPEISGRGEFPCCLSQWCVTIRLAWEKRRKGKTLAVPGAAVGRKGKKEKRDGSSCPWSSCFCSGRTQGTHTERGAGTLADATQPVNAPAKNYFYTLKRLVSVIWAFTLESNSWRFNPLFRAVITAHINGSGGVSELSSPRRGTATFTNPSPQRCAMPVVPGACRNGGIYPTSSMEKCGNIGVWVLRKDLAIAGLQLHGFIQLQQCWLHAGHDSPWNFCCALRAALELALSAQIPQGAATTAPGRV